MRSAAGVPEAALTPLAVGRQLVDHLEAHVLDALHDELGDPLAAAHLVVERRDRC